MKFITVDTYEKLSRQAANIISAQVIIKPDCVLGLATGSSPLGTYKQLINSIDYSLDFMPRHGYVIHITHEQFLTLKEKLIESLEKKFPKKSSFEL